MVNDPISAPINRGQLSTIVLHRVPDPVDASRRGQTRGCVADSSTRHCLTLLSRDSHELLASNVIDLQYFRSVFLFPLAYLRGTLITTYRRTQQLISAEESPPSPKVDLYV